MKHLRKIFRMTMVAMAFMAWSAVVAFAAPDWGTSVITAEGMGAMPPNAVNHAQAVMAARRAAVVDAYRQLAETVNGVNVTAESTVENFVLQSDVTKTKVSALIKGATIISEKQLPGGGYAVTMQIPMFGISNSLASAVLEKPAVQEPLPKPEPKVEPSRTVTTIDINISSTVKKPLPTKTEEAPKEKAMGGFTGLVIDCRGLDLKPVMSPVIKNENGQPIYGYKNIDCDLVISKGMAGYARDIKDVAFRAGSHPLYVKAVRLENHNSNPVISVADANRVLIENSSAGFLELTNVVFLR